MTIQMLLNRRHERVLGAHGTPSVVALLPEQRPTMERVRHCCIDCFEHEWLREYVSEHSARTGRCSYCYSRNVSLIPIDALSGFFANLAGMYREDDDSTDRLIDLVQEWGVFSDRLFGDEGERALPLFDHVLAVGWEKDSGERLARGEDYCSSRPPWYRSTQAESWLEFTDRVRADPEEPADLPETFSEDLARTDATLPAGAILWRIRPGFTEREEDGVRLPYSGIADAGPPPVTKTKSMRASRQGEVVFYGADDEATAIAELRPATGYILTVARFRATRPLRLVDLAAGPRPINPFVEESLGWYGEVYELLGTFGEQLAKPLERDDDQSDYLPCQKLAEEIRETGFYDGIRYPSAMHPVGTNVVIFSQALAGLEFVDSRLVRVTDVRVAYEEYDGQSR